MKYNLVIVFSADLFQIKGDDTPALQAVLDADVWRKHLLSEQVVCPSLDP